MFYVRKRKSVFFSVDSKSDVVKCLDEKKDFFIKKKRCLEPTFSGSNERSAGRTGSISSPIFWY